MKATTWASLLGVTAVLVACGGNVSLGTNGDNLKKGERCSTCSGAAPADARVCPDGTAVGRACLSRGDGTCGYDFPDCTTPTPTPPTDAAPPPPTDAAPPPPTDAAPPLGGEGAACGSRGMAPCAADLFCSREVSAQCGATDIPGKCAKKPQACTADYAPVCGCDGKTYSNLCTANAAGQSPASTGECPLPDGATCGTRGVRGSCKKGSFCKFEIAAVCGATDAGGTCTPVPTNCVTVFDPVCGCDNKTYGNACAAAMASMSVASLGACR